MGPKCSDGYGLLYYLVGGTLKEPHLRQYPLRRGSQAQRVRRLRTISGLRQMHGTTPGDKRCTTWKWIVMRWHDHRFVYRDTVSWKVCLKIFRSLCHLIEEVGYPAPDIILVLQNPCGCLVQVETCSCRRLEFFFLSHLNPVTEYLMKSIGYSVSHCFRDG